MLEDILRPADVKMQTAVDFLAEELHGIRSGRAQAGLVENLKVDVYGQSMVLKTIAGISTPDARMIVVQPWDATNLPSIEKAIRETPSLGLNPSNDGRVVRLSVPALTTERRQEILKLVNEKIEEANVALRNLRHELYEAVKKAKAEKQIGEDDFYRGETELNKKIDQYKAKIETLRASKEKELMEV